MPLEDAEPCSEKPKQFATLKAKNHTEGRLPSRRVPGYRGGLLLAVVLLAPRGLSAQGVAQGTAPPAWARTIKCRGRQVPQLEDITEKAGIHFLHASAPESKYIMESMSGGVLLLDYDRDGWPDIYFTNAPTVAMALKITPRSARGE